MKCPICETESPEIESGRKLEDRYTSGRRINRTIYSCPNHGEFANTTLGTIWGRRRTRVGGIPTAWFYLTHQVAFRRLNRVSDDVIFVRQIRHHPTDKREGTYLSNDLPGWISLEQGIDMFYCGQLWTKESIWKLTDKERMLLNASVQAREYGVEKTFDELEELAVSYLEANLYDALEAIGVFDMED